MGSLINPAGPVLSVGNVTYAGDSTANKAIAHGLAKIPKAALGWGTDGGMFVMTSGHIFNVGGGVYDQAVTAWDATNIYVGNAASYPQSANFSTGPVNYRWVVFA